MKKIFFLLIVFIITLFNITASDDNIDVERVYCFKIISFNKIYDVYATKSPCGYYKYSEIINDIAVYVTYECLDFMNKSKFDENYTIISELMPINLYTNSRGEMMQFSKKFAPVIEKNRIRKNYDYGYGKN